MERKNDVSTEQLRRPEQTPVLTGQPLQIGPEDVFQDAYEDPDMDDYVSHIARRCCPNCGTAIVPNKRGRPKFFCSEKCRRAYWNNHPKPDAWGCYKEKVCPVCGRVFLARHRSKREQKYCSVACANHSRSREFRESQREENNEE